MERKIKMVVLIVYALFLIRPGLVYADDVVEKVGETDSTFRWEIRYWQPTWKIKQNKVTISDEEANFFETRVKWNYEKYFAGIGFLYGEVDKQVRTSSEGEITMELEGNASRWDIDFYLGKTFILAKDPVQIVTGLGLGYRYFFFGDYASDSSDSAYYADDDFDNKIDIHSIFIHMPVSIEIYTAESVQIGFSANTNYSPLNWASSEHSYEERIDYGYYYRYSETEARHKKNKDNGGHFVSALGELNITWKHLTLAGGYQFQMIKDLEKVGIEEDTFSGPYGTLSLIW